MYNACSKIDFTKSYVIPHLQIYRYQNWKQQKFWDDAYKKLVSTERLKPIYIYSPIALHNETPKSRIEHKPICLSNLFIPILVQSCLISSTSSTEHMHL